MYWNKKLHMREIASKFECSRQLVSKHAKELGISGVKTATRHTRERHINWKGGRCISDDGIMITTRGIDKYGRSQVAEHVLKAEGVLGRKLNDDELVHHINGNRLDNRNENLMICTRSSHKLFHGQMGRLYMKEHFGSN